MRFEILHTEGCSGYEATERNLREVLAAGGVEEAEVEIVEVRTDEQAERFRFPGSPTVMLDGRDLFPVGRSGGGGWGLG